MDLLPLREKVSAKLTDEGSRRSLPSDFKPLANGRRRPLIRRLRRHLLPQGEKDGEAIAPRTPLSICVHGAFEMCASLSATREGGLSTRRRADAPARK